MALIESIIAFVVSLLIGALGIYVGAMVLTDVEDYSHAVITALIGAVAWAIIGWIPLLGPILAFIVYIVVLHIRYPGGVLKAVGIALIAWIAVAIVLTVLAMLGIGGIDAAGVPGA